MKVSKVSQAIAAMATAREFLRVHVPEATVGKFDCDMKLFRALIDLDSELSNVQITLQPSHQAEPIRSAS
jgi:hypothetical protein